MRASGFAVLIAAAACVPRARPYRFGAPMVAGAELADPIWSAPPPAPPTPTRPPPAPPPPALDAHVEIATLPAPHRAPRPRKGEPAAALAAPPAALLSPASALALTGARDGRDPLAFALDLRARLTGDRLDAADGPALVEAARRRELLGDAAAPIRPGALLVFDRAVERKPASLVAVALAVDDRGVATFMFLAAGVVRTGYVDPAHPSSKRDARGTIRNTFLRHRDEEPPPGTHFLAGELLANVIAPP